MGNSLTAVENHRKLLLRFGVSQNTIERINYNAFVIDHGKQIQEEMAMQLKKRMVMREGEQHVIVMSLGFLHKYELQLIKEFNKFMLNMGFRIYVFVPLRARYHMERLKRIEYDFLKVMKKYLLPVPEFIHVMTYSDEAESKEIPDSYEQLVSNKYLDCTFLAPFDGPLEPYDPQERRGQLDPVEETPFIAPLEPIPLLEVNNQPCFADWMQVNSRWFPEELCVSNTLQDDEAALGLLGSTISGDMGTLFF